jgi:hypothetical protein
MPAFTFRLERLDGRPADPPVLNAAVPDWKVGDEIFLGGRRTPTTLRERSMKRPDDAAVNDAARTRTRPSRRS